MIFHSARKIEQFVYQESCSAINFEKACYTGFKPSQFNHE